MTEKTEKSGNAGTGGKKGASMVAPHPQKKQGSKELRAVEDLAEEHRLQPWYLAGLRQATGWAPGKQVTEDDFLAAKEKFDQRRMGGGKI